MRLSESKKTKKHAAIAVRVHTGSAASPTHIQLPIFFFFLLLFLLLLLFLSLIKYVKEDRVERGWRGLG